MYKFLIGFIVIFLSTVSEAAYVGGQSISKLYGSSAIKFGISNPSSDTCSYYGRQFIFDATTDKGKNILSILLAAKMANKNINVWYTASSQPGTDEKSGCNGSTLATVADIGISD